MDVNSSCLNEWYCLLLLLNALVMLGIQRKKKYYERERGCLSYMFELWEWEYKFLNLCCFGKWSLIGVMLNFKDLWNKCGHFIVDIMLLLLWDFSASNRFFYFQKWQSRFENFSYQMAGILNFLRPYFEFLLLSIKTINCLAVAE